MDTGLFTGAACFVLLPDGDLLVGGSPPFNGGPMLSRYRDLPDPIDFDCNRTITTHDIFAYLGAWFSNAPAADFNHDGRVDVGDIYSYIGEWFARP